MGGNHLLRSKPMKKKQIKRKGKTGLLKQFLRFHTKIWSKDENALKEVTKEKKNQLLVMLDIAKS